jgi:hypothetical protein
MRDTKRIAPGYLALKQCPLRMNAWYVCQVVRTYRPNRELERPNDFPQYRGTRSVEGVIPVLQVRSMKNN